MLGTLKQKVADADLMQLGRRREWRAFRDGVESARSHLDELIESGEPVEVVFEALEKKVPYLHRLKDKYMDRPGLITSVRGNSQKVSSEDLATAVQIASLYMVVYNYAEGLGYDIETLEKSRPQ